MPFRSKAQQRFMFATNPEKAKEWASETKSITKLPEKKHPRTNPERKNLPPMKTKTASDGMFFEKRSQPRKGRFFRDLPGREDATFHEKAAFSSYAPGQIPQGGGIDVSPSGSMYGAGDGETSSSEESVNVGATGAPQGGMGFRGEGMSGGMYGAGDGDPESDEGEEEDAASRLAAMLAASVVDKEDDSSEQKTAGRVPSDWDADSGMPTGFHRPAYEQPEALESGGERFFSTSAKGPNYGAKTTGGLVEGGRMRVAKGSGHGVGKHASVTPPGVRRFMGTSYGIDKQAASEISGRHLAKNVEDTARETWRDAKGTAGDLLERGSKSPVALGIAGLLAAKFGLRGLKGVGKGALRLAGKRPPPVKPSALGGAIGSFKKLMVGK